MKRCTKCDLKKEDSSFSVGNRVCDICKKEKNKLYYQKNAEKERERKRLYRQNNAEKIKENQKLCYQKNSEKERERKRLYRQDAPEREKIKYKKLYYKNNLAKQMLRSAKRRAIEKRIPFSLEEKDIKIPEICPVLGFILKKGEGKIFPNSPSLDRIIPEKGYVKGNIIVISHMANSIKQNATPEQIVAVGEFFKKLLEASKND